ncbi:MAG: NAD(P)-binding domain-containing protein [Gammaproteobacteria bacterium]|nr:NAD(P)-binding domain-containing protein [Gammaproteobacteria bacterium]
MKIAIIGSRNVGITLGRIWSKAGNDIVFGVRENTNSGISKLNDENLDRVSITTIPMAIQEADWIMLGIPYSAVEDVMQVNAKTINGKVIIDATNRYGDKEISIPDLIQMYAPDSQVFRAFNAMGWENVANPKLGSQVLDIFYTGPDIEERKIMDKLISDTGGRPIWIGDNDLTSLSENLENLWVTLAFDREMGRRIGFKILRDE